MSLFSTKADGVTCTGHDRLAAARGRMTRPASLAFGHTPWDGLSHEDLVFLVASMYGAVADAAHLVGEGCGSGSDKAAAAALRAVLGHVHTDYLGAPVRVPVAYGRGRDHPDGQTDAEALDVRMGLFRDILAFSSPSLDWWACTRCHAGEGRPPGTRPGSSGIACRDGLPCEWRRASWDLVRGLAGVGDAGGER